MRLAWLAAAVCLLLLGAGCEARPDAEATRPPAPPAAVAAAPQRPAPRTAPRDTSDHTRPHGLEVSGPVRDTLIQLGSQYYWLTMSQIADSTKPLDYEPATLATKLYAAPSDTAWYYHRVRGYEGTSTFTLRDSARRAVVFSTKLHKRDFFGTDKGEVLILSDPEARYMGYSAGLHALVFTMYFGLPYSDVIDRTALLLDTRTGRVRGRYRMGSASFEATDCDPRPAPDGQALLTCAGQLLRAGRAPLSLHRPHAELRAALFLTDTTLLVVYEFGDYQPVRPDPAASSLPAEPLPAAAARVTALLSQPAQEFTSSPAQRRQANAFVLSTSGRQLVAFRYDGWDAGMGYHMPRQYVPATRTYYLLNGEADKPRSLTLLTKAQPDGVRHLPFKQLARFRPPQQSQEVKFGLSDEQTSYTFYVDSLRPARIRYTSRPNSD